MFEIISPCMKTAVIDVGGGMRAVYGAGIYDYLMDNDLYPFSLGLGVSAGAADIATYFAKQRGRVLRYYTIYPKRKEYMGLYPLIKHGTFMNLKYIYEDLSLPGCEDPFDSDAFLKSPSDMYFVTTNAATGKPEYFPKSSIKTGDLTILEATAALPVACKPIRIGDNEYFDGGISDPIPYRKAFELGADKVVVILTKPKEMRRDPDKDRWVVRALSRKHPETGKAMALRAEVYNREMDGMDEYEKDGRLLVIAPDDTCGVTTLRHTDESIMKLYSKGYKDAERIMPFLEE